MFETLRNALKVKDIRKRLLFTLVVLVICRLGSQLPIPGIDTDTISQYLNSLLGDSFNLLNSFTGGSFESMSLFALNVTPYITASIIIQLLTIAIPALEELYRDGEDGRKKINNITRFVTLALSVLESAGLAIGFGKQGLLSNYGPLIVIEMIVCLTAGSVFVMWLGEQITEKGIGNGISLIIFSGIVVGIPGALVKSFQLIKLGDMSLFIALALVILMVAVLIGVVFMERAQRRIPIQYAKRQVGRKMYGGQSTHLPLRVNTAGVIPPIFASSLLLFPATMANFDIADWLKTAASWFTPSSLLYNVIFIALIFFFCFFYTAIIFDPKDVAENLKKAGGFIPGIRPGEKTQEYLDAVLSRLTLWGGVYISVISVLPMLLIAEFNVPFYFGGTSILILVGVAMDFMSQIESHLISRQYEGLMGKTRIKGRS